MAPGITRKIDMFNRKTSFSLGPKFFIVYFFANAADLIF
jgi:hypothetical protein